MKQVYINSKERVVIKDGKQVPRLLLGMIRGSIGKCFVVKHYRGNKKKKWKKRIVITKYPNMSGVVASEKQRVRRDLFKEAVVYAQWILSDPERKEAFRKTLPRKKRKHVYQAAIRLYMNMQGDKQWLRKQLAVRGMMNSGRREMADVRVVKGEWMVGNGVEWQGAWRMIWRKEELGADLVIQEVQARCVVGLRI
ncbi:hypothetical protein OCK74_27010 [Chitinophagaceae bacterium LB-8]|uniref:Uncharacterized protein n=1 Tax=Paraflavisolibacter caeni TaxID=2982496 RepID=A0A9X2Y2N2_9BACT|nr:hypothetical protein [Paraflavisolibacter caeni]MCU7552798.1 hypothetical protein [Paraflavisolibacter caeni]